MRLPLTLALFSILMAGCSAVASSPLEHVLTSDIDAAVSQRDIIVAASVSNRHPHAVGTRSEGFVYDITPQEILLLPKGQKPPSSIYHFSMGWKLQTGRYILIIHSGGLLFRAEPIGGNDSDRRQEIRRWIKNAQPSHPGDGVNVHSEINARFRRA